MHNIKKEKNDPSFRSPYPPFFVQLENCGRSLLFARMSPLQTLKMNGLIFSVIITHCYSKKIRKCLRCICKRSARKRKDVSALPQNTSSSETLTNTSNTSNGVMIIHEVCKNMVWSLFTTSRKHSFGKKKKKGEKIDFNTHIYTS